MGLVYRMNSAISCLIRQYLQGNDVTLTCYWEMAEGLAYKENRCFLYGYFQ
jgi:hypothetical protein